MSNLPLNLLTIFFHLFVFHHLPIFYLTSIWNTTETNHRIYFINPTLIFPKSLRCSAFDTIFIDSNIITWAIKFLINIFQLIEFFPWIFVPFSINTRNNVSKICSSKCTFSNHFNRCLICTKFYFTRDLFLQPINSLLFLIPSNTP